jgi:uncharacterized protein YqeY
MSDLKLRLANSVKDAMRAKASERLSTLRFLQAAIKQREVDERKELSDAEVVAIIEKQVKQRKESIAAFEQAGRTETAAQETAEMAVLKEFLPQAASEADVAAAIDAALAEVQAQGVTGAPAMGKVMAGKSKTRLTREGDYAFTFRTLKAAEALAINFPLVSRISPSQKAIEAPRLMQRASMVRSVIAGSIQLVCMSIVAIPIPNGSLARPAALSVKSRILMSAPPWI